MAKPKVTSARPYETDYAGSWRGHCKTRESAIRAAQQHVVEHGYSRATITDKRTGRPVAWVTRLKNEHGCLTRTADPLLERLYL